jgi:hypothetical protein
MQHPPPIRQRRQQHRCRYSHRTGEMRHGGIDRNNMIQIADQPGGLGKIAEFLRMVDQMDFGWS